MTNDLDNDPVVDFGWFVVSVNRNTGALSYNFLNDFHLPSSKPPTWLVGTKRTIASQIKDYPPFRYSYVGGKIVLVDQNCPGPKLYRNKTVPVQFYFLALAIRKLRFEKVGSNVIHLRWEQEDQFAQYIARVCPYYNHLRTQNRPYNFDA